MKGHISKKSRIKLMVLNLKVPVVAVGFIVFFVGIIIMALSLFFRIRIEIPIFINPFFLLVVGIIMMVAGFALPSEKQTSITQTTVGSMIFCPYCGAKISQNAEICIKCGIHNPTK